MKPQKHHIVPDYKCKELGLKTSYKVGGKEFYFKENVVEVTRLQHANIHWGYWCKDLSALLEVCSPPQWVIDMIPLGDKRDLHSAQLLAEGEIGGVDTSGKNNPFFGKKHSEETRKKISEGVSGEKHPQYKHGNAVGCNSPDKEVRTRAKKKHSAILYANNRDKKLAQAKEYHINNRDKILAQKKEYHVKNRDKILAYQKEYRVKNEDEINAKRRERYAKNKDEINAKARAKRQREKQERLQGVGTLVPNMG